MTERLEVLVTGASGFIGRNLCAELSLIPGVSIRTFTRDDDPGDLPRHLDGVDAVFHLAGVNRPDNEAEFESGNTGLTEALLGALDAKGSKPILVFASSTQAVIDNPYGRSKAAAEEAVFSWARRRGARAHVYRLPGIFGKWCRPNYNSVVATFCHNISRGMPVRVDDPAKELSLAYIDDVVRCFVQNLHGGTSPDGPFETGPSTYRVTVGSVKARIESFAAIASTLVVPNFESEFDRRLFATYTSYLPPERFGYALDMKHDSRGWLSEVIKSHQFGQVFVSRTRPGISRGNHWHHTKIEKFIVVSGSAQIKFRDLNSDEVISYEVSGDELHVFDMPAGYVHSITNSGDEDLITLFWADEIFDPGRPDTYAAEI